MRLKILAFVAAGLAWSTAHAAQLQDFEVSTVDQLAALCGVDPDDDLHADALQFCYGYISGAVQFHNAVVATGRLKPIACPTEEATRAEFARYFATWARSSATPEQRAEPAIEGMARAAATRWPCPR